jgi:hypothetical protein
MELQIIHSKIHAIRGQKIMLDFDLADLYEVATKVLNQAVKRNKERFPDDFMFQLSADEWQTIRESNWSQFVTSSRKFRGDAYLPYAFTEQGIAMLSGVLHSEKAIQVNIAIMRAFVELRRYAMSFAELAEIVFSQNKQLSDINEVLKWLGAENQKRHDEIKNLEHKPDNWGDRPRIGYKKG